MAVLLAIAFHVAKARSAGCCENRCSALRGFLFDSDSYTPIVLPLTVGFGLFSTNPAAGHRTLVNRRVTASQIHCLPFSSTAFQFSENSAPFSTAIWDSGEVRVQRLFLSLRSAALHGADRLRSFLCLSFVTNAAIAAFHHLSPPFTADLLLQTAEQRVRARHLRAVVSCLVIPGTAPGLELLSTLGRAAAASARLSPKTLKPLNPRPETRNPKPETLHVGSGPPWSSCS